jgi:aminoglycoside phosphotransferase (APT) family kinase protein
VASTAVRPEEHPAAVAWDALGLGALGRVRVEVLKRGSKSAVYRLHGRRAIVAKRCAAATAAVERSVQEEVLPATGVSAPRFYGVVPDRDRAFAWLFLDDAGDNRYSAADAAHAEAAGEWLAALHAAAASRCADVALPDRSLHRQRAVLEEARSALGGGLANGALACARALLRRLIAHCEELERRWDKVEAAALAFPKTLVHGGFAPKNVRVRRERGAVAVLAFDWEAAGWGTPAADLSKVDLAAYCRASAAPDRDALERLAAAGSVLWCAAAIPGEANNLATPWAARLLGKLGSYEEGMRAGLAGLR